MLLTKNRSKSRGNARSIISIIVSVVLVVTALLLWLNKQYILDWVAFQEYTPTTEVATIAKRTTMTQEGTFYFYASQPAIEPATKFNASCERKESSSAILGCYANNRIFIYDITNDKLAGIKEVTSAHEMLHAVYQRMSDADRTRVNALLEAEYEKMQSNDDLAKRMEFYAKHEAGEKYNELHSIVATEFGTISAELEQHYAKYFANRAEVVRLYDQYASVFKELQQKSESLLVQLKTLGPKIETESQAYNNAVKQLNADIQDFNARATAGSFSSQAEFSSERARLVMRATNLDKQQAQINNDLTTYEKIRQEYNATAATSNELYKSMDSKLAPTPSV